PSSAIVARALTPGFPAANLAALSGLRFQTFSSCLSASRSAMGTPIAPRPANPIRIATPPQGRYNLFKRHGVGRLSVRIAHVDLDACFVEVCRREDPALRDVELLVVGGRRDSRGVVQSASYGARKFGIQSGMPIGEAVRRCPDATFVRGEFNAYRRASRQVRGVLERYAPVVVMTGLDEGYLDLSGTDLLHPVSLLDFATGIRNAVFEESQLDCSIGIGPNRMIAKIASDYAKPRGICEVRPGWERGFMAGLPLKALPGIGPRTAEQLAARGLTEV